MNLESGMILPGKVLVKPIKQEEKKGSIFIPNEVLKPKTHAGEVVLTGEGTANMPMVVVKGDKVLHPPHAFVTVEIEDTEYRLLNQGDILFIWK